MEEETYKAKRLREAKEKAERRVQTRAEIVHHLNTDPKVQQYLDAYHPDTAEDFREDYAREKAHILDMAEWVIESNEHFSLQWVNNCWKALMEIQQKKLFDLQCQWRAGKVQLEGIVCTADFDRWKVDILNCPCLPPVTEAELDMYERYMHSPNFHYIIYAWHEEWQDYELLKEAYESNNKTWQFPEWYDYHNSLTGNSAYLLLPNVRQAQETYYVQLGFGKKKEQLAEEKKKEVAPVPAAATPPPAVEKDERPHVPYARKSWLTNFVNRFEDEDTKTYFNALGGERDEYETQDREAVGMARDLLDATDEEWPIESWYDWREALLRTAQSYRVAKTLEMMPTVYEQYLMQLEMGLPLEHKDDEHVRSAIHHADLIRQYILQGRKAANEPEDFSYLD